MGNNPKIPKLEIEKFTFSPPGPMGWNMSEYEQMLDNPDQLVLNEAAVNSQIQSLQGIEIMELSLGGNLYPKDEQSFETEEEDGYDDLELEGYDDDESEWEEEWEEEEELDLKPRVKIIVEEASLKTPWISVQLPTKKNHN